MKVKLVSNARTHAPTTDPWTAAAYMIENLDLPVDTMDNRMRVLNFSSNLTLINDAALKGQAELELSGPPATPESSQDTGDSEASGDPHVADPGSRTESPRDVKLLTVGDRVQWLSKGAEQWPDPKAIKKIQDDHAFFKGSGTGVPIEELELRPKE